MQVNVGDNEFKKLSKFLSAIVVNKALYWSLHLRTNLQKMRALGLAYWQESQKIKLTKRWSEEKREKGDPSEVNVISGQTKEQALFLTGSGVAYLNGRGVVTTDIDAAPWVPTTGRGSPRWRGYDSHRPFYYLDTLKRRDFWRPGTYVNIFSADKNIWNSQLPDEATLSEANRLLIMSPAKCAHLLGGKVESLGSWKKGSNQGVAAKWR